MNLSLLPPLNASLNASSAFLLALGYIFIRQRAVTAHTLCMLSATATSSAFLVSYITYHIFHGATRFPGHGPVRAFYFTILISHTILAVVNVPLVAITLTRALRGRFAAHVAAARRCLPIWMYVSVTGVLIYWMLYRVEYAP